MRITCIDFETANLNPASACSVGIACVDNGVVTHTQEWRLRPKKGLGFFLPSFTEIHGLTWFDVCDEPEFDAIYPKLLPYLDHAILVAHNAWFDRRVLCRLAEVYQLTLPDASFFCTLQAAKKVWPAAPHGLDALCARLGHNFNHHHAGEDAAAAGQVLLAMMQEHRTSSLPEFASQTGTLLAPI